MIIITNKLKNKKIKRVLFFLTFFPCDAYLRRWISPLVTTARFSIIYKHPTRNQFSKTKTKRRRKKKGKKIPTDPNFLYYPIKTF